jgi:hypothetical protein
MKATTELRKTGWYITDADGSTYTDANGRMWFTKAIALKLARNLGGMYYPHTSGGLKMVVTGYTED